MDLTTTLIHQGKQTAQLAKLKTKLGSLRVSYKENIVGDYTRELANYEAIQSSACVIGLCPDGVVTADMARWALYALLKNKPIIILEVPPTTVNIDNFSKDVMGKRFNKLLVCDLLMLDNQDAETFLRNTVKEKTNYVLTHNERVLIQGRIKAQLRGLLE